ncbi:Pimeloyl-ACP methyl ester carboxylesterase [Filimonas lacunae]|uniref:Pimeloyl-ACP methyl ester carboxylesterase n=1 Tax=Filimonas lacunae TaxID=477680 RepID=A0A173MNJ0_9BACT|nr:alpha/beta hydrolase [Filimonas lacunae]BAV09047.1 2-hydroxy-6-oxo-6-phenylhexa-2,4-dienoate hydrolase [Filimonas lacunae]SIS66400.1 Pimeloyl-ACP methyl ester carboxylesterase [Filimonas lacunae]
MKTRFTILLTCCLLATTVFTTQAQSNIKALGLCLENYTYPYPVQYLKLTLQGENLQMAYMDVKPDNYNGHNVLLLHGKNFNGAYWATTIQALTQKGFRVIVPDQIGFGKSSKPTHLQYTFQLLAQNTKAILDTLGITKINVLGHSMGGMVATRFTLMYPQVVEKFILENPIGLEDWKLKVPYQPVETWYKNELKQNYESIRKYQSDSYYDNKWKPEYDEWVNLQAGWTLSPEYARVAWNAALTYDMIFTQPVCYEFTQITAPTLLIIGQRDRTALGKANVNDEVRKTMGLYPELGKLTQQKIKGSQLVPLDNVGHLPHIEAFDRFIQPLLQFLQP